MTIGISKERLEELSSKASRLEDKDFLETLIFQCTELNHWLPIDENTPKDRPILLYSPGMENGCKQFVGNIESAWWKPTHYQELPGDPE